MGRPRVVLAGPDPSFLGMVAEALMAIDDGRDIVTVGTADRAIDMMGGTADILILDHHMDFDASAVLERIKAEDPDVPVIFLSSSQDGEAVERAMDSGADYHSRRDRDPAELHSVLNLKIELLMRRVRDKRDAWMTEYRLQTLVDMIEKRNSPFHEIAHFVLERMVDITSSTMGYIATVNIDGGSMRMFAWSQGGLDECRMQERPILYKLEDTGLWGEPVRQGQAVVVNDYLRHNSLKKGMPVGHVGIERFMAIPVFNEGRIVATCGVANKGDDYTERDLKHFQLMMNGMGDLYDTAHKDMVRDKTERRYEGIMRNIPVAIGILDDQGDLMDANEAFTALMGDTVKRGMPIPDGDGLLSGIRELFQGCRSSGSVHKDILRCSKDGNPIHLRCNASPLWGADNGFNGAILVMDDVTKEYEAMDMLQRAAHQLRTVGQMTRHDVMNQIQALSGYLELLKEVDDPDMRQGMLVRMEHSLGLINDQMSLSRTCQSLDMQRPLWLDLHEEIRKGIKDSHGIAMNVDIDDVEILADVSLSKVFYNLFDNSMRHGGGVTKVVIRSRPREDGSLVVEYSDDGIGIPSSQKGSIFKKGFGNNTGLGMFLMAEILSLTGIGIRELGEEGRGVHFEISVPEGKHRPLRTYRRSSP